MSKYINQFLSLKCSGDVLNAVGKINKPEKEITEAMAIIHRIKPVILGESRHGNKYSIVDFCSGNCLIPILTAHLLPINYSIAIDKTPPKKDYSMVKKFQYIEDNIIDLNFFYNNFHVDNIIITSCHACGDLAKKVINIFLDNINFRHLFLMPCCRNNNESKLPKLFEKKVGKYLDWCYTLYRILDDNDINLKKIRIFKDEGCLSPCNCIIEASKE